MQQRKRDKIQHARVLIKVAMKQKFTDVVTFLEEHVEKQDAVVVYPLRPTKCDNCHMIRHDTVERKRNKEKQVWVPKKT